MLNHKFYLFGADKEDHDRYIRISDMFIKEIQPDLCKCKFEWNGYETPQYGLSGDITVLKFDQLKKMQDCLLKQPDLGKEQMKLKTLVQRAIAEKKTSFMKTGVRV